MARLLFRIILAAATALIVTACGADKEFRVNGRIDGFGTGNLRLVYYNGEGVQSLAATAVDGRFMVTGRLDKEAFIRAYTNNGAVVGRLIVAPGETVEATFNLSDPTKMKLDGNDNSKRLAKFVEANADIIKSGDTAGLNAIIEKYVGDNKNRAVAGVLLADYYTPEGYETRALEMINSLDRDARNTAALGGLRDMLLSVTVPDDSITLTPVRIFGPGDSLSSIDPAAKRMTLLTFTDTDSRMTDSVVSSLERIVTANGDSITIADIACDPDTATWKRSLRDIERLERGVKGVRHYWTPSPFNLPQLEKMPVRRLPWFILADSTGRIIYRGSSVSLARAAATPAKSTQKKTIQK